MYCANERSRRRETGGRARRAQGRKVEGLRERATSRANGSKHDETSCTHLAARVDRAAVALLDALAVDGVLLAAAGVVRRLLLVVICQGSTKERLGGRHDDVSVARRRQ